MQKLIPILFIVLSLPALAQQVEWGVNIAPSISYRFLPHTSQSLEAAIIQGGEKPIHVFDFGFDFRSPLHKRLHIGAAVLFSQKGFSNIYPQAIFQDDRIDHNYLIDYVQYYLEVPFFLTYSLVNREKFTLYPLAGISNSLLLSEKSEIIARSGEVPEEFKQQRFRPYVSSSRQHNLGVLLGWGATTRVDAKTSVGLEIIGKSMLTPLYDKVSESRRYLYSMGLNFRFIRRLN